MRFVRFPKLRKKKGESSPFSSFFREVNLRSSFEYSILKEILNLLGPPADLQ